MHLGDESRGFDRDGQKVIAANLGYLNKQNTGILSYKTDKWFPLVTLYINLEVALMIGHYIKYFENILVFVLLLF